MSSPPSQPDRGPRWLGASAGIVIGSGLGLVFGVMMGGGTALGLGIVIGSGLGLVIGAAWDSNHPPTA